MRHELGLQHFVARVRQSNASVRRALADRLGGPAAWVLLIALFQVAIWGVLSGALAVATPDDSLEQVLLSQELRMEYGKHPPMPTWLLYAANRLVGPSIGATYVLGALCSVATLLLLYAFARPLVGASRAALAAILLSNIEYMNAGTAYFNHNTVQLPLALLAIMLFHRALTRARWADWALFGAACGLMMLTKFSAVVLFASFLAYLTWTRRLGEAPVRNGLVVAAAVGFGVLLPYLLAVHGDGWSPNTYAMESVFPDGASRIQGLKSVWGFASSQVSKVAPAFLIFAFLRRGAQPPAASSEQAIALDPFLTLVGFGPLVLTVVVASLTGAHLLVGWGATFHVLLTFWLVGSRPFAIEASPRILGRAAVASIALQIALWALVTTHGGRLPNLNPTPHPVPPPTPTALAGAVRELWGQHCAVPLRYVLTDVHTGSALAVRYRGQPRVLDATRPEIVKFFPDDARVAEGAVVVLRRPLGTATQAASPDPLATLLADTTWNTTVKLPAKDGLLHEYTLGILQPVVGVGCGL